MSEENKPFNITSSDMTDIFNSAMIAITCIMITYFIIYFIVVVWWVGLIDVWHEEERLKHETCYTVYGYEPIRDQRYVKVAYCGGPET